MNLIIRTSKQFSWRGEQKLDFERRKGVNGRGKGGENMGTE